MTPFDLIGDLWLSEYDATVKLIRGMGLAADAEDVATECFLELANMIAGGMQSTDPEALRQSLRMRATFRARNAHTRAGAVERLIASLKEVEVVKSFAPPIDEFLPSVLDAQLRDQPLRRAQAFILVILRGCDVTEAARILGLSRPTIYAWVDDVSGDIRERITA